MSVVIPVWDTYAGEGLVEAIASVRSQAVPVELFVVDNASNVVLPLLPEVDLIRLATRCSTGASRNAALERLRTPYVVFLDADDLLIEGSLQTLIDGLDAADERSAYALTIIDGATGRRHRSGRRLAHELCRRPRLFALANAVWSLLPTQGCTIMRVADVRACGGYGDSNRGEDWVLGSSLAFRGPIFFDRRPGLKYRSREDSPGVGSLSTRVLLSNACAVRRRMRDDPATPAWAKSALPLIAVAQCAAAGVVHPLYRSGRERIARAGGPLGDQPLTLTATRIARWMSAGLRVARRPSRSPSASGVDVPSSDNTATP